MSLQKLYITNSKVLNHIDFTMKAMRVQNYDSGIRYFQLFIKEFQTLFQEIETSKDQLTQAGIGIDGSVLVSYLQGTFSAQQQKDYILLADILEIQVAPFLLAILQAIREIPDFAVSCSHLPKNLAALEIYNKELADKIKKAAFQLNLPADGQIDCAKPAEYKNPEGTIYLVEPTDFGMPTLRIDYNMNKKRAKNLVTAYYLHSNRNPLAAAQDFAKQYFNPQAEMNCLLGFGLGYEAKAFMEKGYGAIPVGVFEPDLYVLTLALTYHDFADVIGKQLLLYHDPGLTGLGETLQNSSNQLIIHHPSLNQIENETLRNKFHSFFIEESSMRNAKELLEINFFSNQKAVDHSRIQPLTSPEIIDFKGKTVYIVAAGPSLDVNLDLLTKRPENSIILAVGTVFHKLMKKGIQPDYVMVTDPNNRIIRQIREYEHAKVPMLLLATANHQFAKKYQGPIFMLYQKDFMLGETYAASQTKEPLLLSTGGSVSTTALDFVIRRLAKMVVFLGLDLAFTNNLAHATDTSNMIATDPESLLEVPSFYGGTVLSDEKFNLYREFIQKRIQQPDATGILFVNATEGGSYIQGMKHLKLEEVFKL